VSEFSMALDHNGHRIMNDRLSSKNTLGVVDSNNNRAEYKNERNDHEHKFAPQPS